MLIEFYAVKAGVLISLQNKAEKLELVTGLVPQSTKRMVILMGFKVCGRQLKLPVVVLPPRTKSYGVSAQLVTFGDENSTT